VLRSNGAEARKLFAYGPCGPSGLADPGAYFIQMDGPHIFKFAVQAMEQATRDAVAAAGMTVDDIDLLVPHQANLRIINATAKALGLPPERAMVNVDRYGNTSSASIPMALCEAYEQGRLHEGDRLVLVAFGGGLVWGATVVEWTAVGPVAARETAVHATAGGS
jgi:3-oxoacyl-[acyl-carrier-protein] synthase-3